MKTVFKEIEIKNFASFGNKPTTFNLDRKNVTAFYGENRDIGDEGDSRNGCGKSSLFKAIIWCLYGKTEDDTKADGFINVKNKKNMHVRLNFDIGDDHFMIKRSRKPNSLIFEKNGTSLTLDSMANTDELIQKTIGVKFDIFNLVFHLYSDKPLFFARKPAEQRDIMEVALSLDKLTERAKALKELVPDIKTEIKVTERDLENAQTTNQNIENRIEKLERKSNEFETEKKEKRKTLEEERKDLNDLNLDEIYSLCEEKDQVSTKLEELKKEIQSDEQEKKSCEDRLDYIEKVIEHFSQIEEKEKEHFEKISKEKKELNDNLAELPDQDELDDEREKIEFIKVTQDKINEITGVVKQLNFDLEKVEEEIEKTTKQKDSLVSGVCYACEQPHYDEDLLNKKTTELDHFKEERRKIKQAIPREEKRKLKLSDDIDRSSFLWSLKEIEGFEREREKTLQDLKRLETTTNPYAEDRERASTEMEEKRSEKEDLKWKLDMLETQISSNTDILEDCEKKVNELEEATFEMSLSDVKDLKKEKATITSKIEELADSSNPYEEELEDAKKEVVDTSEIQDTIDDLSEELSHTNYMIKLLTDSKSFVRRNIVDRYVPYLNQKILEYSTELDLPHFIEIQSDLTTNMTYMGEDFPCSQLSNGEKNRLNAATTIAFMDLLKTMGVSLNLLLIDEVFDSALDKSGLRKSFDFLKNNNDTVLLITHKEELSSEVDESVTVVKNNGFTELI